MAAHRWAFDRWVGPIPYGFHVHHVCRNSLCAAMEQVARTETWTKSGHYLWAVLFPIGGVILAVRAWSKSEVDPGLP